jgi:hypothetical protein
MNKNLDTSNSLEPVILERAHARLAKSKAKGEARREALLEQYVKEEIRNYWNNPNGSAPVSTVAMPPKRKQAYQHAELFPDYKDAGKHTKLILPTRREVQP